MGRSANVALRLAEFATSEPERAAVIAARSGESRSYRQLYHDSDALAAGLLRAGLGRGSRIAVMVPPSPDFFTIVFALFKAAAVPVMVDPGMGIRNLGECLAEAEPAAFLGVPKAHVARRIFGWAKGAVTINAGKRRFFCDHSTRTLAASKQALDLPTVQAHDTAAILFTSGSTGLAKGAVYTHGIFDAQVEMLKAVYGISPGEVDLCTFPLFALFGPALGMTCIVPEMDFTRPARLDAARTVAAIEKYQATNLFGSPAVIKRLADYGKPLPSLKRAISAGAPATLSVVDRFSKLLPNAELFTPYGATESLPVANIGSDELLATKEMTASGAGLCVGNPVPGVQVHVIPITDEAVPLFDHSTCLKSGEIGEFVVRGPIVTKSYWKREDATKLAKIIDPATGETLHRIGDVGYLDAEGRLWFCGRKSHRVVLADRTLFTDCVEPVFNTVAGVRRSALVAAAGEAVLCIETNGTRPWQDLEKELRSLAAAKDLPIAKFLEHRKPFPMDVRHNSKIRRERLAIWASRTSPTKNVSHFR